MNVYGKTVKILVARPGRAPQQIEIAVGESYLIKFTTPSAPQQIVITAYDAETLAPIMIDGKNSVFVFPSVTPVSVVYYIPSGEFQYGEQLNKLCLSPILRYG